MKRITPISDSDLFFEIEPQKGVLFKEAATDLIIVWDESGRGLSLEEKYERFRIALCGRFNCEVSKGTAHMILDEAVRIVGELKKTHIVSPNSKPTESVPAEEAKQS